MRRSTATLLLAACLATGCDTALYEPQQPASKPSPGGLGVRRERLPARNLAFDDGIADIGHGTYQSPWQECTVFRNPYPVPARVDTVWLLIHGASATMAPFRFALWNVETSHVPSTVLETTPLLSARRPFDVWGIFTRWQTVLPPYGEFAAGYIQETRDLLALSHDRTRPYVPGRHFVGIGGSMYWVPLESIVPPGDVPDVPMIRVSVSPVFDSRAVDVPAGPARAAPADYERLPARTKAATHSTWSVWGNMSTGCTRGGS